LRPNGLKDWVYTFEKKMKSSSSDKKSTNASPVRSSNSSSDSDVNKDELTGTTLATLATKPSVVSRKITVDRNKTGYGGYGFTLSRYIICSDELQV
jgi:hypothetical protein